MPDARVLDLKPRLEDARRRPAEARAATQQVSPMVGYPFWPVAALTASAFAAGFATGMAWSWWR